MRGSLKYGDEEEAEPVVKDEVVMPTGGYGKPLLLLLLVLSSAALDSEILHGDLHKHAILSSCPVKKKHKPQRV